MEISYFLEKYFPHASYFHETNGAQELCQRNDSSKHRGSSGLHTKPKESWVFQFGEEGHSFEVDMK